MGWEKKVCAFQPADYDKCSSSAAVSDHEVPVMPDPAIEALGNNPPGNLHLNPDAHATRLKTSPQAAPLWRILAAGTDGNQLPRSLRDPKNVVNVPATIRSYCEADRAANAQQAKYNRSKRLILLCLAIAFLASSWSVIVPGGDERTDALVRPLTIMLAYFALAVPLLTAFWVIRKGYYELWHRRRGEAEYLRRRLFHEVMDAEATPHGSTVKPLRLKLEYFRRYQLDLQQEYYAVRGKENRRRAARARYLLWSSLLLVGMWFVLFIAELISAAAEQGATWGYMTGYLQVVTSPLQVIMTRYADTVVLIIAMAMSVILGFSYLQTLLDANLRNAARYKLAEDNLAYLRKGELAGARTAADAGDTAGVNAFIDRVHSVMSTEFAEWITLETRDAGRISNSGSTARATTSPPTAQAR